MDREARSVKFQLMVSPSELDAVDEYRWANRISSRAEAVRQLVAEGVTKGKGPVEGATSPDRNQNHTTSINGGIDA